MEISFYGRFGAGSLLFQEAPPQNAIITVSLWQSTTGGEPKTEQIHKGQVQQHLETGLHHS